MCRAGALARVGTLPTPGRNRPRLHETYASGQTHTPRDSPGTSMLARTSHLSNQPSSPTEDKPGEVTETDRLKGEADTSGQRRPTTGPGDHKPEDPALVDVNNNGIKWGVLVCPEKRSYPLLSSDVVNCPAAWKGASRSCPPYATNALQQLPASPPRISVLKKCN